MSICSIVFDPCWVWTTVLRLANKPMQNKKRSLHLWWLSTVVIISTKQHKKHTIVCTETDTAYWIRTEIVHRTLKRKRGILLDIRLWEYFLRKVNISLSPKHDRGPAWICLCQTWRLHGKSPEFQGNPNSLTNQIATASTKVIGCNFHGSILLKTTNSYEFCLAVVFYRGLCLFQREFLWWGVKTTSPVGIWYTFRLLLGIMLV